MKHKVYKNKNYTVMSNYHIRDKNLSLKAKGLLSMMLTLPDDWDYSRNGLISICKEGQSAIDAALKELEDCGYLIRRRERLADGKLGGVEYHIYELPQGDETVLEKPLLENITLDNQTQLNKELTNNSIYNCKLNKQNKELNNIYTTVGAAENGSPPVAELLTKDGSLYPIYSEDVQELEAVYKGVDVLQELKLMGEWCKANPTKRKTRNGIRRFIAGWLTKTYEKKISGRKTAADKLDDFYKMAEEWASSDEE